LRAIFTPYAREDKTWRPALWHEGVTYLYETRPIRNFIRFSEDNLEFSTDILQKLNHSHVMSLKATPRINQQVYHFQVISFT
jgi:hypothetical protein